MPAQHQAPADEAAEREKFERWAKANTPLKFERDLASYFSGTTQFAWLAWMERAQEVSTHVEAGEMEAGKESRVSLLGLAQRDCVVPGRCDIDKRVSMPAAGADEEAAGVVHFRGDGAEQSREFAAAAGPHGGDGTTGLRRNFDGGKDAR